MSVITVWKFAEALVEAGILTQDQVNRTSRIVIDCDPANGAVILYLQQFANEKFLKVVPTLAGIEVTAVTSGTNFVQRHWCDNPEPHEVPSDCTAMPDGVAAQIKFANEYIRSRYGRSNETKDETVEPNEPC